MKKCPGCQKKLGKQDEAYCTGCGHQLVVTDDLPTLEMEQSIKTKSAKRSIEHENKRLRVQIEKLKETSAVLFGKTEEAVDDRVERILTVSKYQKDILGRVDVPVVGRDGSIQADRRKVPGFVNKFVLYKGSLCNDFDQDEIVYVATYSTAVDLQTQLADIRLLLAECSGQKVECKFVMATNEDLTEHKSLVMKHFAEMKTVLPLKIRALYKLEIWDQRKLRKLESELKIRVRPNLKPKY